MYSIYYLLVYALNIKYICFGPQIINRNLLQNNIRLRENKCIMNLNEYNECNDTLKNNYNASFNYVNSVDYDENQNLWIVDIDTDRYIEDEQEKLNENVINKQLESDEKFPSFYEFIEQRKIKEEIISEYRKKFIGNETELKRLRNKEIDELRNTSMISKEELAMIQNISMQSFYNFLEERDEESLTKIDKSEIRNRNKNKPEIGLEPQSNNLKLLTSLGSIEWAKNWIYDMVHYNSGGYPRFMYYDMFCMKDFARVNDTDLYFYIGYFPSDVNLNNGPYYIGAFELVPKDRAIHTHLIIQNPNYWIDTNEKDDKIINFKKELEKMTMEAGVFFKFSKLQNTTNQRYYYSWLYEKD